MGAVFGAEGRRDLEADDGGEDTSKYVNSFFHISSLSLSILHFFSSSSSSFCSFSSPPSVPWTSSCVFSLCCEREGAKNCEEQRGC